MKKILSALASVLALLLAYLALWPVPVQPVIWEAPENAGYVGDFSPNNRLAELEFIDLDGRSGPEDADIGPDGLIYVATHNGEILKIGADGGISPFTNTEGRPLGIEFAPDGTLYVADAYLGLMAVDRDGRIKRLADRTEEGSPILYANDLAIAADGSIYFSDASTRFGQKQAAERWRHPFLISSNIPAMRAF